ncbi:MAG: isopenicillin N synthase family dioxygenase [Chakrabartia sp.]
MTTDFHQIPTLSLANQGHDPEGFAQAFGASFRRFGFAVVTDHGIDPKLIDTAWKATRQLFELPEEAKRRYYSAELAGQRGYTPFGTEIAKDAAHVDLKEFWHVGRDLPAGHRFRDHMPDNIWPTELAEFEAIFTAMYAAFDRAGNQLLSAIARYLGLSPDWFADKVDHGNSVMRLLHYPPIPADAPGIRAGAHGDINLITLLLGAEEGGLQLLTRQGEWLSIAPPEGALVINVGDMLERLTNNQLPSTIHRVLNPPPERRHIPRYSMPFFLHLASDVLIETLPGCMDADHPNLYRNPITANDFLVQRLIEIGLKT